MPTSRRGCHLPTHHRAVSSHPSVADWGVDDNEDINCEITSLLVLTTGSMRQQGLPGVVKLCVSCLQQPAQGKMLVQKCLSQGYGAGVDGRCAMSGDGHHPAGWALPAEHRTNLAQVRCELMQPDGGLGSCWEVPSSGCCQMEL